MIKHYEFYEAIINADEYFNNQHESDMLILDYGDIDVNSDPRYSFTDFSIDDLQIDNTRKYRVKFEVLFDKLNKNLLLAEKGKDNGIQDYGLFDAIKTALVSDWDEDFINKAEIQPINDHICIVLIEETSRRQRVEKRLYSDSHLEESDYPDFREETIYVVQIEEIK